MLQHMQLVKRQDSPTKPLAKQQPSTVFVDGRLAVSDH
jgi:hypothetical protein